MDWEKGNPLDADLAADTMCGRYSLTNPELLKAAGRFELDVFPANLAPRYNIAPSQQVPAILNQAPRQLQLVRWGLIPSWAKDPAIGYRMINARAETLTAKPAFRQPLQRLGTRKVPHWITLTSGEVFAFAGLWDSWTDPKTNTAVASCTIITTTPNELLASIHDRMPVILPRESEAMWLSETLRPDQARALLQPYAATRLTDFRIQGPALWSRFTVGSAEGVLWYFRGLVQAFREGWSHPLIDELEQIVGQIEQLNTLLSTRV